MIRQAPEGPFDLRHDHRVRRSRVRRHVLGVPHAISVFAACCCVAVACTSPAPPPPQATLRIATGLPTMTFNGFGRELMAAFQRLLPDLPFTMVETPGSIRNLELLGEGQADLALSLADVAYLSYNGELRQTLRPVRSVRGIAVLHHSRVHVLVRADSPITSVSELKGRAIAVGPPGSGTAATAELVLAAYDVRPDSVSRRTLSFTEAAEALARGEVQASFVVAADPVDTVDAAMRSGARLLDLTGAHALGLRKRYPFLRNDVILPGTYSGQPKAVHTLSIDVLLVCRTDLEEPVVRRVTAALFAALPDMATRLGFLRLMDLGRASASPVPLHPGAAWYYRERELAR